MLTPPDEIYSTREAAEFLRKSERQVQRYLADGKLGGNCANAPRQITALALWKYQGIEQEMSDLWLQYCCRMAHNTDD